MTRLLPEACRAARAILRWSTEDLARESGVAGTTINRLENGQPSRASTEAKLVAIFSDHGVEILNGDAPGARLQRTA
jgi:transcriptional regulator with XRE-family HTH domain